MRGTLAGWRKLKPEKALMYLTLAFLMFRYSYINPHAANAGFIQTLWLPAALLAGAGAHLFIRKIKRHKVVNMTIEDIDAMSERDFEAFLMDLFRVLGYSAKKAQAAKGSGAAICLEKDGMKIAVRTKKGRDPVGVSTVEEAVISMAFCRCANGMVVTTSHFTRAAKALAFANRVALWDRKKLERKITLAAQGKRRAAIARPVAGK